MTGGGIDIDIGIDIGVEMFVCRRLRETFAGEGSSDRVSGSRSVSGAVYVSVCCGMRNVDRYIYMYIYKSILYESAEKD